MQVLRPDIESLWILHGLRHRCIPIETQFLLTFFLKRRNGLGFSGVQMSTNCRSTLRFEVHDFFVHAISKNCETITPTGWRPITILNCAASRDSMWSHPRTIVLQTTEYIIWLFKIMRYTIELSER